MAEIHTRVGIIRGIQVISRGIKLGHFIVADMASSIDELSQLLHVLKLLHRFPGIELRTLQMQSKVLQFTLRVILQNFRILLR